MRAALIVGWALVGALALFSGADDVLAQHVVTPDELTHDRILSTQGDLLDYVADHHKLPEKLTELPEGAPETILDGWGKPLVYQPQKDGSVILGYEGQVEGSELCVLRFPGSNMLESSDRYAVTMIISELDFIEIRVRNYVKENHRMPAALSDLSNLPPWMPFDGWDSRIFYSLQADGSGLVTNNGKIGNNQIISLHFTIPDARANGPATVPTTEPARG
jgi:hypothetical protein